MVAVNMHHHQRLLFELVSQIAKRHGWHRSGSQLSPAKELDHLFKEAQTKFGLQGLRAKNSFFLGVAQGYNEKMKESKKCKNKGLICTICE